MEFAMRLCCLPLCLASLVLSAGLSAAESSPLAASPSAFVRAQSGSAVRWHVWNDTTLAEARQQQRCVYVFIGSPLSELTRATIRQTFTSEKTVAWLNENFFCIFVDADERPDLASYGQHYIRSIKQLQGVPVHLWLTPDLQLFDGANYLPPSEEWGKPGFLKAARSALDTWNAGPARPQALAQEALDLMRVPRLEAGAPVDLKAKLDAAAKAWIGAIDPAHGGFGSAPKQPEPEVIRFLLLRGDPASRDAALNAARALVKGAARDATDGGYYRRCIDEAWKEPYYQKTLLDQARIALALYDAADAGKDDALRQAANGALDFALKELRNPDGTFVAALDGTMEENADPTKRPEFARVGVASTGARALLLQALQRSDEKRFKAAATSLAQALRKQIATDGGVPHLRPGGAAGTAFDHLAVARAFLAMEDRATAERIVTFTNGRYFDAATGAYQASPAAPPAGIAARVPAYGDTPLPEVLALRTGVDANVAARIRQALLLNIEYDDQPPGDVLLGLSQGR
jgi:uncharacterized protein YyaL (SSP411 family)